VWEGDGERLFVRLIETETERLRVTDGVIVEEGVEIGQ